MTSSVFSQCFTWLGIVQSQAGELMGLATPPRGHLLAVASVAQAACLLAAALPLPPPLRLSTSEGSLAIKPIAALAGPSGSDSSAFVHGCRRSVATVTVHLRSVSEVGCLLGQDHV